MGGAQYQAKLIVDYLLKTNEYEIYYLARRVNKTYNPQKYKIITIPGIKFLSRYGFFFDFSGLLNKLKQIKPDIIYQRVACAYTGIAAYYAKRAGCTMIWHIANDKDFFYLENKKNPIYLPHKFIEKKFMDYGILNATHVIAQNQYQADMLLRYYKRNPSAIIYNFHPLPSEKIEKKDPIKVVWVANFKEFKQPQLFIKIADNLKKISNVQFIMVGAPADNKIWHSQLLTDINKLDNLSYLGPLKQEKVNEIIAASHIFVNTSIYEGFANTFVQAWMREVPVVSLNVNPNGVFDSAKIGILSGSFEKMCEDVKLLIDNTILRNELGEHAKKYAIKKHSEKNIEDLVAVFNSVQNP